MKKHVTDVAIIGSGPGGTVSAITCLEAGLKVSILEEGMHYPNDSPPNHNIEEIRTYCRQGGLSFMFGNPKISYAEGRCLGGGSEVNGGLYHRPPEKMLKKWKDQFGIQKTLYDDLVPSFEWVEGQLHISNVREPNSNIARKLQKGAEALNWKTVLVPQWFGKVNNKYKKFSMSQTILPQAKEKNCQLFVETWVEKISKKNNKWLITYKTTQGTAFLEAQKVILAAGAIQTPALLQRSKMGALLKSTLACHPMLKVMAEFPEKVQHKEQEIQIGNTQVKEFDDKFTYGCAVSSQNFIAQASSLYPDIEKKIESSWDNMAIYYTQIHGDSKGQILTIPYSKDPIVRYNLTKEKKDLIRQGTLSLCHLLFKAGATAVYPLVHNAKPMTSIEEAKAMCEKIVDKNLILSTIHLFGSCPMAIESQKGVVDAYGSVFNQDNLHIHDGSILCAAPGVNPQGTIMALARRNTLNLIN